MYIMITLFIGDLYLYMDMPLFISHFIQGIKITAFGAGDLAQ